MPFKKLPAIKNENLHIGCKNCSSAVLIAPLEMVICVGFGAAFIEKDGLLIYDGESEYRKGIEPKSLDFFEKMAEKDPDHDWRFVKVGPLHSETFQRHGEKNWVCIESTDGFA